MVCAIAAIDFVGISCRYDISTTKRITIMLRTVTINCVNVDACNRVPFVIALDITIVSYCD